MVLFCYYALIKQTTLGLSIGALRSYTIGKNEFSPDNISPGKRLLQRYGLCKVGEIINQDAL